MPFRVFNDLLYLKDANPFLQYPMSVNFFTRFKSIYLLAKAMVYHAHVDWKDDSEEQYIGGGHGEDGHQDYHNNDEYSSNPSDDYQKLEENEEKEKDEKGAKDTIEEAVKAETREKAKDEGEPIIKKAAKELFQEGNVHDIKHPEKKAKEKKSIEDAINQAIKEEKEVIYTDE